MNNNHEAEIKKVKRLVKLKRLSFSKKPLVIFSILIATDGLTKRSSYALMNEIKNNLMKDLGNVKDYNVKFLCLPVYNQKTEIKCLYPVLSNEQLDEFLEKIKNKL